jgi:ferrochelatase
LRETNPTDNRPKGHPNVELESIGVLLINLGTPAGTDYWSVRRYLREFLSDPRVIDVPRLIWLPLLNGVILSVRPQKSARAYRQIWDRERNESPLRTITRAQSRGLGEMLASDDKRIVVDWAMRYGSPSIGDRLAGLHARGCERILLAPLYPQYSATTTATANDMAFAKLKRMRWQPAIRTLPPYYDDDLYIDAIAASIDAEIATLAFKPEVVLASYHGLPQSYLDKGDPYYCHCHKTSRLLTDRLGWPDGRLRMTFQSRFGGQQWLTPYTDETLVELADQGIRDVAVVTPGFSADCLETLEEIALQNAERFRHHGGRNYAYIPCLNDGERGMSMLHKLVLRELSGWL